MVCPLSLGLRMEVANVGSRFCVSTRDDVSWLCAPPYPKDREMAGSLPQDMPDGVAGDKRAWRDSETKD